MIPHNVWNGLSRTRSTCQCDLFVVNGDLTTYKATIKERNLWVDMLVQMANHAPVILVAGNHGKELDGDLLRLFESQGEATPSFFVQSRSSLSLTRLQLPCFPYPRKAEMAGAPEAAI